MTDELDRRGIDLFLKRVAIGFVLFLLGQGVIGAVTAIQVVGSVKQNTKDIDRNTKIINADNRTLIRVEIQLQRVTEDIKEIQTDAKETQRLLRRIYKEVK